MKKLTFLIPSYKAQRFFEVNKENWTKLSTLVELIIVNDNNNNDSEEIANDIGALYFNKKNGNWGSVINFAITNKIVTTEYLAIVDSDDEIDTNDLKELLNRIVDKDTYITNFVEKDFITHKKKTIYSKPSRKGFKFAFIHTLWFKVSLLNDMPELPEGVPHMDLLLTTFIMTKSKSHEYVNLSPYVYNVNVDGQTDRELNKNTLRAYEKFLKLTDFIVRENVFGAYRDAFNHLEKLLLTTKDKDIYKKACDLYKRLYKMERYKNVFNRLIFIKIKRYLLKQYKNV